MSSAASLDTPPASVMTTAKAQTALKRRSFFPTPAPSSSDPAAPAGALGDAAVATDSRGREASSSKHKHDRTGVPSPSSRNADSRTEPGVAVARMGE